MAKDDGSRDQNNLFGDEFIAELYVEQRPILKKWFTHHFMNSALSDDLVQEVFVRLAVRLREQNRETVRKPVAFLYFIAGRVLTDELRRQMQHVGSKALVNSMDEVDKFPDPSLPVEERLFREETLRQRQKILEELPERQRQVIHMQISGCKPAEIAAQLKLPIATVRTLQQAAYNRCQRRLRALQLIENESDQ